MRGRKKCSHNDTLKIQSSANAQGQKSIVCNSGGGSRGGCILVSGLQSPRSKAGSSRNFFLPIGLWYQLPNKSGVNFTTQVKFKPKSLQHYSRIYESKHLECLQDFATLKFQCLYVRYMIYSFVRVLKGYVFKSFALQTIWRTTLKILLPSPLSK